MNQDIFKKEYFFLLAGMVVYSILAYQFNFVQDDAYISYRYVANFLNGDGLVYNIGERIEGFTNFGWVIYLILFGSFISLRQQLLFFPDNLQRFNQVNN